jgi:copper transport protein
VRRLALRSLVIVWAVAGTLLLAAAPASAHALAQSSDPPMNSSVNQPPTEIKVTFGETPDPKLSQLRVLDSSGQNHATGKTVVFPGDPKTLEVRVGPLAKGVYTVSWRTVSAVDGHLASNSFAFGVGVTPTGVTATATSAAKSPTPSTLSVVARWLFYAGLMGLVGGAFVGLVCYESIPRRLGAAVVAAWALGVVGAGLVTIDARQAAGLAWSMLWGSSLAHQLLWRAIPLAVVLILIGVGWRMSGRGRRAVLGLVGIAGLVAMWGDVEASHAAASHSLRLLRMADQWAHFAAAGIWVGGLAVLLVTIGGAAQDQRLRAATRYSLAALCSVIVVAGTGFQRAYDEVGSLHGLFHTGFGQFVVAKIALFGLLLGLGAVNRYRSVPGAVRSTRLLQVVGRTELLLVAGVLAATGIIQSLAPPATAAASPTIRPLVLTGHDFGTTVKVKLTVSPDTAGFNQFTLSAVDYDTAKPITATASLAFTVPSKPDLGSSSLPLIATKPGVFTANGANLSINAAWSVVLTLQRPSGGVQIPFTVTPRLPPEKIVVEPGSGVPTTYTLELAAKESVQTYLDPGHPGFDEFHVTVIGADGQELQMSDMAVTATAPNASAVPLTVRKLDPIGHYVADIPRAVKGSYQFHIVGTTTADHSTIEGTFTIPVK